jgi:rod shape-determining protein MreD
MWLKYLSLVLLFYFLAVLQNSFFGQFTLFGGFLLPVFILFFTVVFFEGNKNYNHILFYSVVAGFFLDVFLNLYFGISIIGLLIAGLIAKKIQNSLQGKTDKYPVSYFIPIFLVAFLVYNLISSLLINITDASRPVLVFSWNDAYGLFYNLLISIIVFYAYKRIFLKNNG